MPTNYAAKKRLYLQHPEPDVAVVRKSVTRYIPPVHKPAPRPPRVERPAPLPPPPPPVIEQPAPPPVVLPPPPPPPVVIPLPLPPPPPPPRAPTPDKVDIDVISVDVDPCPPPRRRRSRSRSKRRAPRETRELERVIERDHYIPVPYPVETEPQYETFRYVEGPRAYQRSPSPPPRRAICEDERQHIRISDRERTRERW